MQRVHGLVATAVLGLAALAGVWLGAPEADPAPVAVTFEGVAPRGSGTDDASITVHVGGAVRSPGLVRLGAGDRVAHAIDAAGGALAVAELSALNLAAVLDDGDQVIVPVKGAETDGRLVPAGGADGLVDINHAAAGDLEDLPGVGPVLAERIFRYREEHGPFETVEDLLDVPGIGEAKLAALREALVLK